MSERVLRGHIESGREAEEQVRTSGLLRIHPRDLIRPLTTFRGHGHSAAARSRTLADFGRLYFSQPWEQQYAGQIHRAVMAAGTKGATR